MNFFISTRTADFSGNISISSDRLTKDTSFTSGFGLYNARMMCLPGFNSSCLPVFLEAHTLDISLISTISVFSLPGFSGNESISAYLYYFVGTNPSSLILIWFGRIR